MRRNTGYTLFELMIALAITAIVAAIAVPTFSSMQTNGAISGLSAEIVQMVHEARIRALSGRRQVSLVQGAGSSSTDITVPSTAASWVSGWRLLSGPISTATVVQRSARARDAESGTGTIAVSMKVYLGSTVDAAGTISGGAAASAFAFNRYGQMVGADGTTLATRAIIIICAPNVASERGRVITISALGQIANNVVSNPATCS